eukprot:1497925-Ditylum_brightwellii.AAC.1
MGSVLCSKDDSSPQKTPPTNLSIEKLTISLDGKKISTEDLQKQKCTDVNYNFIEDINQLLSNYYKKYCNVTYRIKEQCADIIAKNGIAACIDKTELKKS